MPADNFYEELGHRLSSDEFCLSPEEAEEADLYAQFATEPVDMPRQIEMVGALAQERQAWELYKQAMAHLARCSENYTQTCTRVRELLNGKEAA